MRALLLALALFAVGCDDDEPPARARAQEPEPTLDADGCVTDVASLSPDVQAGMSVAHNYQHRGQRGYGSSTSRATLEELRDLGVRWVSLTPFGFMRALDASEVHLIHDRPEAENDGRMRREIEAAHARGLRVFLKPHVWIGGGAWRGDVRPRDWSAWFASYRTFILHYARMAESLDVELLAVGVELPCEGRREPQWRALIAEIRAVYHGELTYAANWDRVDAVPFWPALDYVGVQFYPSLADELGAPEAELERALARQLDALGALSGRVDRPVLLTEVGYKSIEGAEVHPHEWPERHGAPTVSEAAQARAYRRLFGALAGRGYIRGVYLWKWFTDPDTDEEGADGFSPRGKRAEAVLRSAYAERCR